jgi:lipopolysaccharide assembly outer membrane protein LptD (OstA)
VSGSEIVLMSGVSAKFNDGNNPTIYVTSDKAIFNNNNFNTKFENNVKVTYMENIITSKNLDLDFDKNTIFIYNNVIYDGLTGAAKTDNIVIDLLTKNAEIFMNKPTQKVKVISK